MHGPTCIFWANLTPFSLKLAELSKEADRMGREDADADAAFQKSLSAARRSRLRVLARRASAYANLEDYPKAAADYKEARKMDPENEELAADEAAMAAQMAGKACLELKAEADGAFGRGEHLMAEALYAEAVKLSRATDAGPHLGCLSNLAAARLVLGQDGAAVAACDEALPLAEAAAAGPDAPRTAERAVMRLHVRRGTALARLGQAAEACGAYRAAKEAAERAGPTVVTEAEVGGLAADLAALEKAATPVGQPLIDAVD